MSRFTKCEYNFLDLVKGYVDVKDNSLLYADWLDEECGMDALATLIRLHYRTKHISFNAGRGYDYRSQSYKLELPDFTIYYSLYIINRQYIFYYRFWLNNLELWFSIYNDSVNLFERLHYQLDMEPNKHIMKAIQLNERGKHRKA